MKSTIISIIISILIIGGALFLTRSQNSSNNQKSISPENIHNVNLIDGQQVIEINAKGGYTPEVSLAKANLPTILRFKTNGTFDCSASVRIPGLNISKIIPSNASTDINIGPQPIGKLQGICGMGMYNFSINFN